MRAALTTLSEKSQESNDNATDATDDWAVSGRVGRRRLLHAFNWASRRRAPVGGAAASLTGLGMIALCEALGWWQLPFVSTPSWAIMLYLGLAISLAPIYLVTWRVSRRFGWRGIALATAIVAVIGPPRDYLYAATFPKWMVFSPGVAPIIADSVTYILS